MREHRIYLFTTTVAAAASIVLILSLLGLGADFGANVWPQSVGRGDEGRRISLPESPPPAAPRGVFTAPARVALPVAIVVPAAGRAPAPEPTARDRRGAPGDGGLGTPRRRVRRRAPPAPAPPPSSPALPPAPPAAAAPPPAATAAAQHPASSPPDDDDERSRERENEPSAPEVKQERKAGRGDKKSVAAAPPVPAPAPPAAEEEADRGDDDDDGDQAGRETDRGWSHERPGNERGERGRGKHRGPR